MKHCVSESCLVHWRRPARSTSVLTLFWKRAVPVSNWLSSGVARILCSVTTFDVLCSLFPALTLIKICRWRCDELLKRNSPVRFSLIVSDGRTLGLIVRGLRRWWALSCRPWWKPFMSEVALNPALRHELSVFPVQSFGRQEKLDAGRTHRSSALYPSFVQRWVMSWRLVTCLNGYFSIVI